MDVEHVASSVVAQTTARPSVLAQHSLRGPAGPAVDSVSAQMCARRPVACRVRFA